MEPVHYHYASQNVCQRESERRKNVLYRIMASAVDIIYI